MIDEDTREPDAEDLDRREDCIRICCDDNSCTSITYYYYYDNAYEVDRAWRIRYEIHRFERINYNELPGMKRNSCVKLCINTWKDLLIIFYSS